MKGPRDMKQYVTRYRVRLRAICFDDLNVFKWERCKKWRKQNRKARDGSHGSAAQFTDL